ncbi:MAG: pyridoxal phosphate-dependent aminotransferase [Burkholderiales bacterium]
MTSDRFSLASRLAGIEPFHVMALLARARELEAQGRSIIHMEIGEPDFQTPQPVVDAALKAIAVGDMHYLPALGMPALRAAIARHYDERYGVAVSPDRVVVTPGASGALLLAVAAVVDAGERVLMTDPTYPCDRHFVRMLGGEAVCVPVDAGSNYQLTAAQVALHWDARTTAVMIASPANPTGTLIDATSLADIAAIVRARRGALIVDEIYHGLVYDGDAQTALALGDDVIVINSFSKYFGMTGWRLGWLVAPAELVPAIDRLAQNIFLAASTPAQHAALAALGDGTREILEARRQEFRARRDYLVPALAGLGFGIAAQPQGAFYVYARCDRFTSDSFALAQALLDEAGVAITPGIDFGEHRAREHVRFAYTTSLDNLREGVRRLREFLGRR